MGLLASAQVDSWRKGRVDFLERVIQGNLKKISSSMTILRRWATDKGLKPSETQYMRHSRTGKVALQFSNGGNPAIEKIYRTHFVSPALSEKKEQRLQEKLNQSPKPVVFQNLRESQCSQCGAEIEQASRLNLPYALKIWIRPYGLRGPTHISRPQWGPRSLRGVPERSRRAARLRSGPTRRRRTSAGRWA
jgi:DNA-directed RNA polymerase subunit K/omega